MPAQGWHFEADSAVSPTMKVVLLSTYTADAALVTAAMGKGGRGEGADQQPEEEQP